MSGVVDLSPVKAPAKNSVLTNILITVLWDTQQKIQLSHAQIPNPHKLWEKCAVLSCQLCSNSVTQQNITNTPCLPTTVVSVSLKSLRQVISDEWSNLYPNTWLPLLAVPNKLGATLESVIFSKYDPQPTYIRMLRHTCLKNRFLVPSWPQILWQ